VSKLNYTGFIAGSLCKSVRCNSTSVVTSRKDTKPVYAGLFEFVMSHYAGEVARMRAGVRKGDA
jgi:hypothetical protein